LVHRHWWHGGVKANGSAEIAGGNSGTFPHRGKILTGAGCLGPRLLCLEQGDVSRAEAGAADFGDRIRKGGLRDTQTFSYACGAGGVVSNSHLPVLLCYGERGISLCRADAKPRGLPVPAATEEPIE
jgi:hypothetical protein